MNLLSEFDVAVLQAARRVLEDLDRAAGTAAADSTVLWHGHNLGRLQQQAETAEWAVFQALNVAASRCHDARAIAALASPGAPELGDATAVLQDLLCPVPRDPGRATRDAAVIGGGARVLTSPPEVAG